MCSAIVLSKLDPRGADGQAGAQTEGQQAQVLTNAHRIAAALAKDPETLKDSDVLFQMPTEGRVEDPQNRGDMYNRPFIDNDDGSTSTVYSVQFEDDKGSHIVSSIWNGKLHKDAREAIERYYSVGDNGLMTYQTQEQAERADRLLHLREVNRLRHRGKPQELEQYAYSLQRADHPERFDENGNYRGKRG